MQSNSPCLLSVCRCLPPGYTEDNTHLPLDSSASGILPTLCDRMRWHRHIAPWQCIDFSACYMPDVYLPQGLCCPLQPVPCPLYTTSRLNYTDLWISPRHLFDGSMQISFSTNESMEAEAERISFMSPVELPSDHNSLNTSICLFTLPF